MAAVIRPPVVNRLVAWTGLALPAWCVAFVAAWLQAVVITWVAAGIAAGLTVIAFAIHRAAIGWDDATVTVRWVRERGWRWDDVSDVSAGRWLVFQTPDGRVRLPLMVFTMADQSHIRAQFGRVTD